MRNLSFLESSPGWSARSLSVGLSLGSSTVGELSADQAGSARRLSMRCLFDSSVCVRHSMCQRLVRNARSELMKMSTYLIRAKLGSRGDPLDSAC